MSWRDDLRFRERQEDEARWKQEREAAEWNREAAERSREIDESLREQTEDGRHTEVVAMGLIQTAVQIISTKCVYDQVGESAELICEKIDNAAESIGEDVDGLVASIDRLSGEQGLLVSGLPDEFAKVLERQSAIEENKRKWLWFARGNPIKAGRLLACVERVNKECLSELRLLPSLEDRRVWYEGGRENAIVAAWKRCCLYDECKRIVIELGKQCHDAMTKEWLKTELDAIASFMICSYEDWGEVLWFATHVVKRLVLSTRLPALSLEIRRYYCVECLICGDNCSGFLDHRQNEQVRLLDAVP